MNTTRFKKKFFSISRWLHIYVAMTFFTLLVFFCVTGITLNHTEWLDDKSKNQTFDFNLSLEALHQLQERSALNLTAAQNDIEAKTNLSQPRSIDIDLEANEVSFDYTLPAGSAFIMVDLGSGAVTVEHSRNSLFLLFNDLHKGRHTGIAWSWLIDITAIAITIFSLTGLIILFQHHKKRGNGITLATLGFILPLIAYFMWVPHLSIQ